eukprot:gene1372-15263_t
MLGVGGLTNTRALPPKAEWWQKTSAPPSSGCDEWEHTRLQRV